MSLTVHYICAYYPASAHKDAPPTQSQWDAYKFCIAVKSQTINGYVVLRGKTDLRIDSKNVHVARDVFGRLIMVLHKNEDMRADVFVPAPSKDSWSEDRFRSLEMTAQSLAGKTEIPIEGLVRFTQELERASQGGPRSRRLLEDNMAVARPPHHDGERVVLIDDIVTSGRTLLATKAVLERAGYSVVTAITCGRTVYTVEPSFELRSYELSESDHGSIWSMLS